MAWLVLAAVLAATATASPHSQGARTRFSLRTSL